MPFTGFAGHVLMLTVACMTMLLCVLRYWYARAHGTDKRSARQYTYDMSKIAISQTAAWAVNLGMTSVVSSVLASLEVSSAAVNGAEGIGWYAAIFMMDFLVGVPVGLWLSRWLNHACDAYWRSWLANYLTNCRQEGDLSRVAPYDWAEPPASPTLLAGCCGDQGAVGDSEVDSVALMVEQLEGTGELPEHDTLPSCMARIAEQNRLYGKYGRHHHGSAEDVYMDRWGPRLDGVWWASQLATFSAVIAVSRCFSGFLIVALLSVDPHVSNPVVAIAQFVTKLPLTCGEKQWAVAGGFRIAVDVLQFLIFDAVNRLRIKSDSYTELP